MNSEVSQDRASHSHNRYRVVPVVEVGIHEARKEKSNNGIPKGFHRISSRDPMMRLRNYLWTGETGLGRSARSGPPSQKATPPGLKCSVPAARWIKLGLQSPAMNSMHGACQALMTKSRQLHDAASTGNSNEKHRPGGNRTGRVFFCLVTAHEIKSR
jgi:hypothetical protein